MKHKFYSLLIFALVLFKPSHQHGAKGASFSGSFSSSSSSSQSSSSSSSSSGSFHATGSLNDIGPGLKDLIGNFGNAGANAGGAGATAGYLGGAASKGGSFANSGSLSSSGAGAVGGVGGSNGGVGSSTGISGSGSFGGSVATGDSGTSCSFGNKNCGGKLGVKKDGLTGNYGSSFGVSSGSGSFSGSGGNVNGFVSGQSASQSPGLGVGGGIGIAGPVDQTGPSGDKNTQISTSGAGSESSGKKNNEGSDGLPNGTSHSVSTGSSAVSGSFGSSTNVEPLPLIPSTVTIKPAQNYIGGGSSGSTAGSSSGSVSSGVDSSFGSSANVEPLVPSITTTKPSQVYIPGDSSGSTIGSSLESEPSGSLSGNIPGGSFPIKGGNEKPVKGGSYNAGSFNTGYQPVHHFGSSTYVKPIGTNSYNTASTFTNQGTSFPSNIKPVSSGTYGSGLQPVKKPCCTGPFPGPSGSIYDSKPASTVPSVPTTGGTFAPSSITTEGFGPQAGGITTGSKPCCKGPFPGPSGSIHDSKPASSIPSVPGVVGTIPSFPSSGVQSGTFGNHGTINIGVHESGALHPPCCKKPVFPGPTGSIHESKPVSSVSAVTTAGNKYTGPFPGPTGSITATVPLGVTSTGNVDSQSSVNTGISGWNKPQSPGNGHEIIYYNALKPAISLSPPLLSGAFHVSDYNKPLNSDFIVVGKLPGTTGGYKASEQPGTGPGYATGTINVEKSGNTQIDQDQILKLTTSSPGFSVQGGGTGPFGISSTGSASTGGSSDSNFATGNVVVQKPVGSVTEGKNLQSNSGPSTISTTTGSQIGSPGQITSSTYSGSSYKPSGYPGYTTGHITVHKPIGSINVEKEVPSIGAAVNTAPSGSGFSGSSSGSYSGTFGDSGSGLQGGLFKPSNSINQGTGFATGNVIVQKPNGSVISGNGSPSSGLGYDGSYSGSVGGSSTSQGSGIATGNVAVQKPDGSVTGLKDRSAGSLSGSTQQGGIYSGPLGTSGSTSQNTASTTGGNGFATGNLIIQKPDVTLGKGLSSDTSGSSGSFSGSGSNAQSSSHGSLNSGGGGYATGNVIVQKPDGTFTGGKDLPLSRGTAGSYGGHSFGSSGSGGFGSSGSGLFGIPENSGFGFGHGVKGSFGGGSFGSSGAFSSAGAYSSAHAGTGLGGSHGGSDARTQSGAETGFTGILKDLFGKHGLGGNLGVSGGSGSFAKSSSFAGSSSYAGSSSGSFSGHY